MIEFLTFLAVPVVLVHVALDLFDRHRHGIRIHDWVSVVAYAVLALHFGLDIVGVVTT